MFSAAVFMYIDLVYVTRYSVLNFLLYSLDGFSFDTPDDDFTFASLLKAT